MTKPQLTREEYRTRRKEYIDNIMRGIAMAQEYMEDENYLTTKDEMKKSVVLIDELFELDKANIQYLDEPKEESKADKEENEDADEQ